MQKNVDKQSANPSTDNKFANQCLELAKSLLSHHLNGINDDGSVTPANNELLNTEDSAHAAFAIGGFYKVNGPNFETYDLADLAARCVTNQIFSEETSEKNLAYTALGILSFGNSKDRNLVWERLLEPTKKRFDQLLLVRTDSIGHQQAYNIAKSVVRCSIGLSKKDETNRLVDRFLERIDANSSGQFFSDDSESKTGSVFDIKGLLSFALVRYAIQLHPNSQFRERKLPSLRTYVDKYLKILPELLRADGLGWCYGEQTGIYGQILPITMILQALCDGWISEDKKALYSQLICKLFYFFFITYVDQEHGALIVKDAERSADQGLSTRMGSFDAAHYLCLWANLAKRSNIHLEANIPIIEKTGGRYIGFNKTSQKEHGLFVYKNTTSGLHLQLPLVHTNDSVPQSHSLAFPHCPGIIDWPVNQYLPILVPELTFGKNITVPAFYGKNCVVGIDSKQACYFRYEQPELMTIQETMTQGIGSCKVTWTFSESKITADFVYQFCRNIQLNAFRYMIALASPHSLHRVPTSLSLGNEFLRVAIEKNDFQAEWVDVQTVSDSPDFKTNFGKIHYLQILQRRHPLNLQAGTSYRLSISLSPDIIFAGDV